MISGDPFLNLLWLVPLGIFTGAIGTMVGVGGGFIIVPVLMALYPEIEPGRITSLSLAVIAINAFSGTYAYAKQKRVDFRVGSQYAVAGIPGILLGSWVVTWISRDAFNLFMGIVLIALGLFMLSGSKKVNVASKSAEEGRSQNERQPVTRFNRTAGLSIALVVGFLSTVLGIGGGIAHVPALIYFMNYSPHRATATSQYVLACMTLVASIIHVASGHLEGSWYAVGAIGAGMIIGAQIGARWSARIQGFWLLRGLSAIILLIGIRVLYKLYS